MQIKLEFFPQRVTMTVPPCSSGDDLHRAFMSGYATMVLEDVWEQLNSETPATFDVPVTSWRHLLRSIKRGYDFSSTYKKPAGHVPQALTFFANGVQYATEQDIPRLGDFLHDVGSFNLLGPELIAIDPCYHDISEAVAMIAKPGTWKAQATMRDEFNGFSTALLAVAHDSVNDNLFDPALYEAEPAGVAGVDSGTCGFFDRSAYPTEEAQHEHEDGTFYKGCCDATDCKSDYHDNERAMPMDIVPGGVGVNSRTFIGDGGYRCFVRRNSDGEVIAACLVFDYGDKAFRDPEDEEEDDC